MELFPPPLHLCLYIILKCQSAFALTLRLPFSSTLSHTHTGTGACTGNPLHAPFIFFTRVSQHILQTHTHKHTHTLTRDGHTHEHNQNKRVRERDPKHQNSINPLRRSLKGFLKADFQHTEAFQVSTVCGGSGAEAFKLYAFTFSTLLLPISSPLSHIPLSDSSSFFFLILYICPAPLLRHWLNLKSSLYL